MELARKEGIRILSRIYGHPVLRSAKSSRCIRLVVGLALARFIEPGRFQTA